MHIWTIANQKGGVGKTTTSAALAGLLAQQGHRVLLVDLDPHGSLTAYAGFDPDKYSPGAAGWFAAPQATDFIADICPAFDCLSLVPCGASLGRVERRAGEAGMGLVIKKRLRQLPKQFDYVLLDCPPLLGVLLVNGLASAQQLIIPVQTDSLAISGLDRLMHTLAMIRRSGGQVPASVVVPTMVDLRTRSTVNGLAELRERWSTQLWDPGISVDTRLRDAVREGVLPHQMGDSRAVAQYRCLLHDLIGSSGSGTGFGYVAEKKNGQIATADYH